MLNNSQLQQLNFSSITTLYTVHAIHVYTFTHKMTRMQFGNFQSLSLFYINKNRWRKWIIITSFIHRLLFVLSYIYHLFIDYSPFIPCRTFITTAKLSLHTVEMHPLQEMVIYQYHNTLVAHGALLEWPFCISRQNWLNTCTVFIYCT